MWFLIYYIANTECDYKMNNMLVEIYVTIVKMSNKD